jgi:hypothetical protein
VVLPVPAAYVQTCSRTGLIATFPTVIPYFVSGVNGSGDVFLLDKAWFYVTLPSLGYLISVGKVGRRHHDA